MSLSAAVRAGWCAFTRRFEGDVPCLYLDTHKPPICTVGLGCALFSVDDSLALPWRLYDRPASQDEVRGEWARVRALPGGMVASKYKDPVAPLLLTSDAIDALALQRLDADVVDLERIFGDLSTYPDEAATALCSIAWAEGAEFSRGYPKFTAAVGARDWATALAECSISEVGNPGVRARNVANRALLASLVSST